MTRAAQPAAELSDYDWDERRDVLTKRRQVFLVETLQKAQITSTSPKLFFSCQIK